MANPLGTRTLLARPALRSLKIGTGRFGSAASQWGHLERSARSLEQMFTATDWASLVKEQMPSMKIATTCSGWLGMTEFGNGGLGPPGSITCHLGRSRYKTWVRPRMEPF